MSPRNSVVGLSRRNHKRLRSFSDVVVISKAFGVTTTEVKSPGMLFARVVAKAAV
jgi:hypothetical protein